jgi:glycerol kinase
MASAAAAGAPRFVLAIDQGTTSSRAILFDVCGRPAGAAQREHTQVFPQSAWVEHDAEEIWERVVGCVAGALEAAGVGPGDVAAVGITNQRETVVVWDAATGKPLHNALVWQDQRGAPLCEELARGGARVGGRDRFRAKTGEVAAVVNAWATGLLRRGVHCRGRRLWCRAVVPFASVPPSLPLTPSHCAVSRSCPPTPSSI